jgi:outer membrane biosynthesis protein TonB
MNRLQRKCFIASAGLHSLLALILLVGPAFLSSRSQPDNMPILDFVPVKTVDALMSGGGNPNARPPAPAPPAPVAPPVAAPAVQPPPEKVVPPEPAPKEPVKEVKPIKTEPESLEVNDGKKHRVEVSTTLVKRSPDAVAKARAEAQARAAAEERRQASAAIGRAVAGIEGGLSGSTTIELKGPGGGGVPYANWVQAVNSVYQRAWNVPPELSEDTPAVKASVTIARDGTVVSADIIHLSGNAAVDQSVRVTLNRVRHAAPLPDDAKEDQRTIIISFINDKARRLL